MEAWLDRNQRLVWKCIAAMFVLGLALKFIAAVVRVFS